MTPKQNEKYSLVIPAYNEETRIIPLFDAITRFKGELIVVCDGTDGTADVVDRIATLRKDLNINSSVSTTGWEKEGESLQVSWPPDHPLLDILMRMVLPVLMRWNAFF
jgi:glycosyltransferase involved in cell wall biosynthesis